MSQLATESQDDVTMPLNGELSPSGNVTSKIDLTLLLSMMMSYQMSLHLVTMIMKPMLSVWLCAGDCPNAGI